LSLENQLSDFDNFWYQYSGHNLPSNTVQFSTSPTVRFCTRPYLGKADHAKYTLKETEHVKKTSLTLLTVTRRKISRF